MKWKNIFFFKRKISYLKYCKLLLYIPLINILVSMILKRDQLQKWSRRLNDISKTKRLLKTLCHLALWLVHTGSQLKESGRHLQRNEKHWQMLLLSCWQRNFANKLTWYVTFSLCEHLQCMGNSHIYNFADYICRYNNILERLGEMEDLAITL